MPPPKTLPADFFNAPQSGSAPDTLPADFFNTQPEEKPKQQVKPEAPGFAGRLYESTIGGIYDFGKQVLDKGVVKVADEMGTAMSKRFQDNPRKIGTRDQMFGGIESIPTRLVDAALGPIVDSVEGDIKSGNYGGAAGTTLGNLLMLKGPAIAKGVGKALPAKETIAESLKASAAKQYGQALNPTKQGMKNLSQKQVVPGLLERNVVAGSLKGLREKAAAQVENLGAQIGDYWQNMPDEALAPVDDIINRVRTEATEAHTVLGANGKRVPLGDVAESALKNSESLASTLESVAVVDANGLKQIPVKKLREMRQYFDEVAARAKRYQGADLSEANKAEAYGKAADAIREEFAKADPDLAAVNREFSFWKNVEKVADETILRREGQAKPLGRKLAEGAGAIAGATQAGLLGGVIGKYGMSALESIVTSPAWRTLSAVTKNKLADAIAKGQTGTAQTYINMLKKEAATASVPAQSNRLLNEQSKASGPEARQ